MVVLLDSFTSEQQVPVLETLEVPYVILKEVHQEVVIFTMEMARGLLDMRVAQSAYSADVATSILEAIKGKGLLETGQEVRERIAALGKVSQDERFNFCPCKGCDILWPHGYLVNHMRHMVVRERIDTLHEILALSGRVEDSHLITLLQQGVEVGLAANVFDGHDRYEELRKAFVFPEMLG